ncbi:hypothetical protein RhiirC2_720486, partial [Rhizophagus irregularis]
SPGHELHPSAIKFVPTLQKLSDEIMEEIRFLTVVAKSRIVVDNSNDGISNSNNNGKSDNIMNIRNPVEKRPKGHFKSNKRMKNTLELSNMLIKRMKCLKANEVQ